MASYILPIASTTKLGGVMVDGTSVIIDKEGKITAVAAIIEYSDIVYCKEEGANGDPEFWRVDMTGVVNLPIPIALPANLVIEPFSIGFKRTTNKIIFGAETRQDGDRKRYIYTCNLDGSELKRIMEVEEDFVL